MNEGLRARYASNDVSLVQLANELRGISSSNLSSTLSDFRNCMKEQFDGPILSYMKSFSRQFEETYLAILSLFARGQNFFGAKIDLRELVSNLTIWRIPVSLFYHSINFPQRPRTNKPAIVLI